MKTIKISNNDYQFLMDVLRQADDLCDWPNRVSSIIETIKKNTVDEKEK